MKLMRGIFITGKMIIKTNKSQIATIIVFIIAVMFIFTLVSLNLGKIAQEKTAIDNVADSVGLNLASQLGSMANAIKNQMKIYGSSLTGNCDLNWKLILGVVLIVAAIIAAIVTGGVSLTIVGVALTGLIFTAEGATMQFMAANPQAVEAVKLKFRNLSALQQIIEMPIQGVLFSVNSDPGWTTDVYDMDRDGDYADRIPRFLKWYNLRLNTFPGVGRLVDGFLTQGFPAEGMPYSLFRDTLNQERFYRDLDENWMVRPGEDAISWWIDYNGEDTPADGLREFKMVPWMRDELPQLLSKMREYGYGINVRLDSNGVILGIDDGSPNFYEGSATYGRTVREDGGVEYDYTGLGALGSLISEIVEFEQLIIRGLSDIDRDAAVQGLDAWAPLLRNNTNEDWYNRLQNLKMRLAELRNKLSEREGQIHNCVEPCWWYSWDCLGSALCRRVGSACQWVEVCDATDPDTGACTSSHQEPIAWQACCGAVQRCGLLCGSGQCPPPLSDYDGNPINRCQTPLGGEKYCCVVTDLEPYNRPTKGCFDNIVEVYPNTGGIKHNALTILDNFIADISQVQTLIDYFSTQIKDVQNRTYDEFHEAFYLWQDKIGGVTSQRETISHIVYARIEDIDPGAGFELPHVAQTSQWKWGILPQICMTVKNGEGRFRLTVARFDENPKGRGLLNRFWRLVSSRGVISPSDKALIEQEAANYTNQLERNIYYQVPDGAKATLKNILQRSGIVTKIEVNYGPGETPEPPATVPAARRNRDIYIVRTSSNMNM